MGFFCMWYFETKVYGLARYWQGQAEGWRVLIPRVQARLLVQQNSTCLLSARGNRAFLGLGKEQTFIPHSVAVSLRLAVFIPCLP